MSSSSKTPRVVCFIDGFNLYHSIKEAERQLPDRQLKWLDIPSLCHSYLHQIGGGAILKEIHYFTAFADQMRKKNPEKLQRHKAFVRALIANKVIPHLGKFIGKEVWSHELDRWVRAYEEKETDVAIACEVLSCAMDDDLDVAVLLTGDSDFAPVAETFNKRFHEKRILFALPFARGSKRLKQLCPESFSISKEAYAKHQLPYNVKLPSGKFVTIPESWKT